MKSYEKMLVKKEHTSGVYVKLNCTAPNTAAPIKSFATAS